MNRRGLTLLEMLAALSLMSLVIAGASSWLVGSTRAERALRDGADERAWVTRAAERLRRDLDEAVPGSVEIDAERRVVRAVVPDAASEEPRWRRVEWSFDLSGHALRRGLIDLDHRQRGATHRRRTVLTGDVDWRIEPVVIDGMESNPAPRPRRDRGVGANKAAFDLIIGLGEATATVRWRPSS